MGGKAKHDLDINWNQVYYFSEIAAAGSLKDAAERLGLSPSTLSEHLSQLESDLNVQLFHRQHRRLVLTEQGARLFQHAKLMFETGRRLIDVISPIPLGAYPVSIGLVPGASYSAAYRVINEYASRFPDVSLRVFYFRHDELEQALLEARLDFGFTDRKAERKNLRQSTLASSALRFFVSDALEGRGLGELLKTMPLLVCKANPSVRTAVEEALESLDLSPRSVIFSEFPSLIEDLCRRGAGVAVLGREHFDRDDGLRVLRLPRDFPAFSERLYATWTPEAENSKAIVNLKPIIAAME